ARIESVPYGQALTLGDVRVSLHPAGHVLGSAQIRIEGSDGVWVVAGDYKRAADPTCDPFEPVACDVFVTEATFALPIYRWKATDLVVDEIVAWQRDAQSRGSACVLFCYALGKAQRLLAHLADTLDAPAFAHGAIGPLVDLYRAAGVTLPAIRTVVDVPRRH